MYSNILIAVDPSKIEVASESIDAAKRLLKESGHITILSVIEEPPTYYSDQISGESEHSIRLQMKRELERFVSKNDIKAKIEILVGHACGSIINHQLQHEDDLIIIKSHKPHDMEHLTGATAQNVLRAAACPVLVLR